MEPLKIDICSELHDCWLAVRLMYDSRLDPSIRDDIVELMRRPLSLCNSPVLADLARSFVDNRNKLSITALWGTTSSPVSDLFVRLSTEAAFSLLAGSSLFSNNCLALDLLRLFLVTANVSSRFLFLPNNCSPKLRRSDATSVGRLLFASRYMSRNTRCRLSATRHRP